MYAKEDNGSKKHTTNMKFVNESIMVMPQLDQKWHITWSNNIKLSTTRNLFKVE